jgi:tetratricopeptide (TPR) repeat protein
MNFDKTTLVFFVIVVNLFGAAMSQADEKADAAQKERADILEAVWSRLETGDSWQAAALVESKGKPLHVAGLYSNLLRDLYFKKHDIPRMILMGQAGIRYCLSASAAAEKNGTAEDATRLKGIAKEISYNLSVNTWPAWEDEGIVITRSDQRIGLDAARLNLRLAGELKRSPDKVGGAWWLIGVHEIALGEHEKAIKTLQQASESHRTAKQPDFEQMCVGYVAIARLEKDRSDTTAGKQLNDAVAALKQLDTEDAKFFARQLISVNAFFAK